MKRVSDRFFIQVYGIDGKPTFQEVERKSVPLDCYDGLDLFIHKTDNGYWRVSSGYSGMSLTRYSKTQKLALDALTRLCPR